MKSGHTIFNERHTSVKILLFGTAAMTGSPCNISVNATLLPNARSALMAAGPTGSYTGSRGSDACLGGVWAAQSNDGWILFDPIQVALVCVYEIMASKAHAAP